MTIRLTRLRAGLYCYDAPDGTHYDVMYDDYHKHWSAGLFLGCFFYFDTLREARDKISSIHMTDGEKAASLVLSRTFASVAQHVA